MHDCVRCEDLNSGVYLPCCNALYYCRSAPTFRKNILPPSSRFLALLAAYLAYSSTVEMVSGSLSKTPLPFYRTTRRFVPEDGTLHIVNFILSYISPIFTHSRFKNWIADYWCLAPYITGGGMFKMSGTEDVANPTMFKWRKFHIEVGCCLGWDIILRRLPCRWRPHVPPKFW
jgi:hypothetical protein